MKYLRDMKNEYKKVLVETPPVLMALFFVAVVLMNLLANKSLNMPVNWLALDAGVFMSGFIFLVMDIVVILKGPKFAFRLSLISLVFSLFVTLFYFIVSKVPGQWGASFDYEEVGDTVNKALDSTLASSWFIVIGSAIAFLVSAGLNSSLNYLFIKITHDTQIRALQLLRGYITTFMSQFVDNLIFALLVSLAFFGWSIVQCAVCAITGALIEVLFELLFTPFGLVVLRYRDKRSVLVR